LLAFFRKKKPVHNNPIISSKRVIPGLKVWECDITTGDIIEAEIVVTPYFDSKGRARNNRKVQIKKNCIYEYAMNGENATRKFETRILKHLKTNG
jgi:hypothetical protein